MANDIESRAQIEALLRAFYGAARRDALLGPIFEEAIPAERWEAHIQRVADFWETVLFSVPRYRGSPFLPHLKLSLLPAHFERWFQIFCQTIETHFEGPNATRIIESAHKMAILFASKYNYYRTHPNEKPLI